MKDIIINIVLIIVTYIICQNLGVDSNNPFLENILDMVPLLIPMFTIYISQPHLLLKIGFLKDRDISYDIDLIYKMEDVSYEELKILRDGFITLNDRVIYEQNGEYIYKCEMQANRALIIIEYDYEDEKLILSTKQDTTSKKVFSKLEYVNKNFSQWALNKTVIKQQIQIKTIFMEENQEKKIFLVDRLFNKWQDSIVNIQYNGLNGSTIIINNTTITAVGNDLGNCINDLKDQLIITRKIGRYRH